MLTSNAVLERVGQVPNTAWEWGWYPTENGGKILTLAVTAPGGDENVPGMLVVLEFTIDEPLKIDLDTSVQVILEHKDCRGVCFFQTALVKAVRDKVDFETALVDVYQRFATAITYLVAGGPLSGSQLKELLKDPTTPEGLKDAIRRALDKKTKTND